jgi:enoyl-[acyl-carrier protein] reductase III
MRNIENIGSRRPLALVTGASRGVGRAIALELATRGFDIVINYLRHEDKADETRRLVQERGAQGWLVAANVGEPDEIKSLFAEISQHQKLAVLVHNAAIGAFKDLFAIRPNQLELAFRVNVFALLWLARAALPMMEEEGGKIIALSSLGSQRVVPHYGIVGPSKAALEAMVRYLAHELRPRNIVVNAVSGGFIETDALHAFPNWEEMVEESLRNTPGQRLGQPEDLARIVGALASQPAFDWVCGQTILADGGYTLS